MEQHKAVSNAPAEPVKAKYEAPRIQEIGAAAELVLGGCYGPRESGTGRVFCNANS